MSKKKKKGGLLGVELSPKAKKILIVATSLVVLLAIVIVTLVVLLNQTKPTQTGPLTAEQKRQAAIKQAAEQLDIIKNAQNAMDRGDSNKVSDIYQSEVKNQTDPAIKVKLLVDESRVYYSAGQTDKAISIAKSAESLTDNKFLVANWLSQVYESDKQYTLAAQYYTLAGKWAGNTNDAPGFTKAYYDQKAANALALAKAGS